ncbi:hypothetical protein V6N13_011642 [Hibiscus sabdariffa]
MKWDCFMFRARTFNSTNLRTRNITRHTGGSKINFIQVVVESTINSSGVLMSEIFRPQCYILSLARFHQRQAWVLFSLHVAVLVTTNALPRKLPAFSAYPQFILMVNRCLPCHQRVTLVGCRKGQQPKLSVSGLRSHRSDFILPLLLTRYSLGLSKRVAVTKGTTCPVLLKEGHLPVK